MSNNEKVAGVRLADGSLVFVAGVPASSEYGLIVRFRRGGEEIAGSVEIPVSLVEWCDPETVCGIFVAVPEHAETTPAATAPPVLLDLVAGSGGPTDRRRQAMLATAWAELWRLDDV